MKPLRCVTIALLFITGLDAFGHGCDFEWNKVELPELKFKQTKLVDVLDRLNEAIDTATDGKIERVAILDTTPTPAKILDKTGRKDLARAVKELGRHRHEAEERGLEEGYPGFETYPITASIRAGPSIACELICMAASSGMRYKETEAGAVFKRPTMELEARVYPISNSLRRFAAKKVKANLIFSKGAVPCVFGQEADWGCWMMVVDDEEISYCDGKVQDAYIQPLPGGKELLVLAPKQAHQTCSATLRKKGLIQMTG